jgi:hypothetical protein
MDPKPTAQLPPAKKPYTSPVLHVYGSIAALTKSVDKSGMTDGGKGQGTKT